MQRWSADPGSSGLLVSPGLRTPLTPQHLRKPQMAAPSRRRRRSPQVSAPSLAHTPCPEGPPWPAESPMPHFPPHRPLPGLGQHGGPPGHPQGHVLRPWLLGQVTGGGCDSGKTLGVWSGASGHALRSVPGSPQCSQRPCYLWPSIWGPPALPDHRGGKKPRTLGAPPKPEVSKCGKAWGGPWWRLGVLWTQPQTCPPVPPLSAQALEPAPVPSGPSSGGPSPPGSQ